MLNSEIYSGSGNDSVHINVNTNDSGSSKKGLYNSLISSGSGNDVISVSGNENFSKNNLDYIVDSSYINSGSGKDYVNIFEGLLNSSINLGEGNDFLSVQGGIKNSFINAGEGKDTINFNFNKKNDFKWWINKETLVVKNKKTFSFITNWEKISLTTKKSTTLINKKTALKKKKHLLGSNNSDWLVASKKSNKIKAGSGNDWISSWENAKKNIDSFFGGKGKDIFDLRDKKGELNYSKYKNNDYAKIMDFELGQDKIIIGSTKKIKLKQLNSISIGIFKGKDKIAEVISGSNKKLTVNKLKNSKNWIV